MNYTILIVDDEKSVRASLRMLLEEHYKLLEAASGEEALEKLLSEKVDLMLLDIRMPGIGGMNVLKQIEHITSDLEVIMVTADQKAHTASEALNLGAYHYITKPFDSKELLGLIRSILEKKSLVRENITLRSKISKATTLGEVIGTSAEMQKVISDITKAIRAEGSVLINGESGTEKELIAYTIHQQSARGVAPFVTLQCAQRFATMLDAELFGRETEAAGNVFQKQVGALEDAQDGVLFLNEIGAMPPSIQEKFLAVLQAKRFKRQNGKFDIPFSARIICASSVSLRRAVSQGHFNEELYHYLNVVPIDIPPLRQRKKDIPLLVDTILQRYNRELGCSVDHISEDTLLVLSAYDWPGNITELEAILEQCIATIKTGVIEPTALPLEILIAGAEFLANKDAMHLTNLIAHFKKSHAQKVLADNQNNQLLTALQLKIDPAELARIIA